MEMDINASDNGENGFYEMSKRESKTKRGVSIVWKNLRVTADVKKSHIFKSTTHTYREIIRNVDGAIGPGNLVAILGASGAGKSTFMTVLANRNPENVIIDGDIRINGEKTGPFMRKISGFVYQDDMFLPTLTISEHLNIATQLKCKMNGEKRQKLVNDIISELGLQKCAHSRIGITSYGREKLNLSGGERKRLSVATELLTDPPLLFCDEPTTGLDSYSAKNLMNVMRKLANERMKTIICSIHQPNEEVFHLFHRIILLSNGKIAFIGSTEDALTFFQSQGFDYNEGRNAADFLVQTLAVIPDKESESLDKIAGICSAFKTSKYAADIDMEISKSNAISYNFDDIPETPNLFFKLWIMTYRSFLNSFRDSSVLSVNLINKLITGVLISLIFRSVGYDTQYGVTCLAGAVLFLIGQNVFPAIYLTLGYIPQRLPLFKREYANNLTTPLIFLLSNIFSLLPGFILDPALFTITTYFVMGLRQTFYGYFWTTLITVLVFNSAAAVGVFLALTVNMEFCSIVCGTLDQIFMAFSGLYLALDSVPPLFNWFRYISLIKYGCEGIFITQMKDVKHIACTSNPEVPCLKNGLEVLRHYSYDVTNFNFDIYALLVVYFVSLVVSYFTIHLKLYFKKF